jgi:hypothetical protein
MSKHQLAKERYREHRKHARAIIEEELFHALRIRVDVIHIDEDVLRKAERQWYDNPDRLVNWDWESEIMAPLLNYGPRTFYAAYLIRGELCALAAARLSPAKKWLSLTHVEGARNDNPLKGKVLPVVLRSLAIFRAVAATNTAEMPGIRVLRPTADALPCYYAHGYEQATVSKKDSMIIIESPTGRM